MKQNLPLIIAIAGGAALFFMWQQRNRASMMEPQALSPSSVPQEWIEGTPEGYRVIGTSADMFDILT